MSIKVHTLKNFDDALFHFIAEKEVFYSEINFDSLGIPIIGYGHTFFTVNESQTMEICKDLNAISIVFSSETLAWCHKVEDLLKEHPLDIREIQRVMQHIDLSINKEEGKALFFKVIRHTMDAVEKRIGSRSYKNLKNSKELLALVYLAYYGGAGLLHNGILQSLHEQDRKAVWYKIRYTINSGKTRSKDIIHRCINASNIFGLTNNYPTASDIQKIEVMMCHHATTIYKQEHAFSVKSGKHKVNPYADNNSMKAQLKLAKHYLLHAKDKDESITTQVQNIVPHEQEKSHSNEKEDDLLEDWENMPETFDMHVDDQGNVYFNNIPLSGVKHINSEGIYEDTQLTYKEDKGNLIITEKKNPENNLVIPDWYDKTTQDILGIVLDKSPNTTEDTGISNDDTQENSS